MFSNLHYRRTTVFDCLKLLAMIALVGVVFVSSVGCDVGPCESHLPPSECGTGGEGDGSDPVQVAVYEFDSSKFKSGSADITLSFDNEGRSVLNSPNNSVSKKMLDVLQEMLTNSDLDLSINNSEAGQQAVDFLNQQFEDNISKGVFVDVAPPAGGDVISDHSETPSPTITFEPPPADMSDGADPPLH